VVWGFQAGDLWRCCNLPKLAVTYYPEVQFQKVLILEQRSSQPLSKEKSKRRTTESAVPIERIFSAAIAYRHV
jgi:hypothetical protein